MQAGVLKRPVIRWRRFFQHLFQQVEQVVRFLGGQPQRNGNFEQIGFFFGEHVPLTGH